MAEHVYMSPIGDDANDGLTELTPKLTPAGIRYPLVAAGTTIHIKAGTYYPTMYQQWENAFAVPPARIKAAAYTSVPGDGLGEAVFDFTGVALGTAPALYLYSYGWDLERLAVINASGVGFGWGNTAHSCGLIKCRAENNTGDGFYLSGTGYVRTVLRECLSKNNGGYGFRAATLDPRYINNAYGCVAIGNSMGFYNFPMMDECVADGNDLQGFFTCGHVSRSVSLNHAAGDGFRWVNHLHNVISYNNLNAYTTRSGYYQAILGLTHFGCTNEQGGADYAAVKENVISADPAFEDAPNGNFKVTNADMLGLGYPGAVWNTVTNTTAGVYTSLTLTKKIFIF